MCKSVLKTCFCVLTNAAYLPELDGDVIGVDKGALICLQKGIKMTSLIGDFDSIDSNDLNLLKSHYADMNLLSCRKDVSDSEAAVLWAKQQGYERIVLLTSMSGRFDHSYVNFRLVEKYGCELMDQQNHVFLIPPGMYEIIRKDYQYVSFFSCDDAVVSLEGFEYPLDHYHLKKDDVLCLSNEIKADKGRVATSGKLWCILSKDMVTKNF